MTPDPIPCAERLPGPDDCDAEGFYWCIGYCAGYEEDPDERVLWTFSRKEDEDLDVPAGESRCTHWLPAHALPLPEAKNDQRHAIADGRWPILAGELLPFMRS
jgi:hypothetical protein